ncbi:MAG TPA: hypothetical protein VEB40_07610 [Flavipsychrobacter sp.]|nr:hypothetical protein [Flavipsychrobacter sp.]
MNTGRLAILLFFLALAYAALKHKRDINKQATLIGRFTRAAKSLQPVLKPGSGMLVKNSSEVFQFPALSRYVVAPAHVAFSGDYDTVLSFAKKEKPLTEDSGRRKIIWQHTDDLYQYSLSVKP